MPSIGGLLGPAAAGGIGRSLALARGANPRASPANSFDQQLDLAIRAGVGDGAGAARAVAHTAAPTPTSLAFDGVSGVASIEALRDEHRTALAEFEDRFRRLLRESGIDLGDGVVLETNSNGDVQVVGEHPHRHTIERLFQNDVDLRNSFMQLESRANLIRAADQAAELARLHAELPADAAAQMQQLLATSSAIRFSLAVRPHETLVQFN